MRGSSAHRTAATSTSHYTHSLSVASSGQSSVSCLHKIQQQLQTIGEKQGLEEDAEKLVNAQRTDNGSKESEVDIIMYFVK